MIDAIRVHERMLVRAGHRHSMVFIGNAVSARRADDRPVSVVDPCGSRRGSALSLAIS
jgi:hypothetical protein